ncbi:hypothetical protein Taro_011903 [Colocasia esculenta]|uniref:Sugar phosphate transporter domain-containing protein n=1 Tax=Colocasia esculenta TaxID=4460 RepID=A0A843U7H3_COLES|nr:hypothetical protein [Colocasia esculenta]
MPLSSSAVADAAFQSQHLAQWGFSTHCWLGTPGSLSSARIAMPGSKVAMKCWDLSSSFNFWMPGRTLEELRASLYNDFQSSEGAKRQQQQFCGPVVAMTFNFMVAVGIIFANKLVMGKVGFNFPIVLSLIHYTTSWLLLAIFKALSLLPASPPSKSTPFSSLFSLGVVMAFSTGLANVSLKHNSVGFYQMAKISVTPTIVLAEFILFGKKVSLQKVLALTVVSIGVAVATVTDLEFNFFGACVALAWIVPSAVNKILWSNLQQSGNWTALALMWKTTPVTVFFLVALMPLLDPPDPGVMSLCGAVVALGGMSVYTSLNLQGLQEAATKQLLPRQASFASKPKAVTDNGKIDTKDTSEPA